MRLEFDAVYEGVAYKANGTFALKFKAPSSEIASVMQCVLLQGKAIVVGIKLGAEKMRVGVASYDGLMIDRDNEAVLKLAGETADLLLGPVELDKITKKSVRLGLATLDPAPTGIDLAAEAAEAEADGTE